ncbi:MAG: hypothetical protein LH679_04030 [Cyanobacteria bacterium CAN_BIN43]|nr:hypothetical protein [Cyanobacteria bacterium CAN_BIN43]
MLNNLLIAELANSPDSITNHCANSCCPYSRSKYCNTSDRQPQIAALQKKASITIILFSIPTIPDL